MRLFTTIAGMRCYLSFSRQGKQVGFVPTMGALHKGHLSLIQRARSENDIVIVSIFVNPLQFGPTEDFQKYPRTLESDCQLCEQEGVDAIFAPTAAQLYDAEDGQAVINVTNVVPPASMTSVLCGRFRPGHFQGVTTVVAKLFNLIQPERAYFGQKDAQQVAIIRRMVNDLNFPVEVVAGSTIRESSGLAFSSRNQYLTPEQKKKAAVLYCSLQNAQKTFESGDRDRRTLIAAVQTELALITDVQIEYIDLVHPYTLTALNKVEEAGLLAIAAKVGSTRLIDNIILQERKPIVAIDGPAGAGKSTVTRKVAQALGLLYLDTGAMYRALTWLVLESGISIDDEPAIAELASQARIQLAVANESVSDGDDSVANTRVWINGQEVTQAIRSLEVTQQVSAIAAQPSVRRELVKEQQRWGQKGGIVAEGRDIGTNVFPDADLKIFLTASVQERAKRRQQDLKNQGYGDVSLEDLAQTIAERDRKDSSRALAPLRKAADAIEINTDGLTIAEVIDSIINLYNQKISVSHLD